MIYAVFLQSVSKVYRIYAHGWDRLWEILTYRPRAQCFQALYPLTFHIPHGQVVGIVGKNGAGKSTLLKIVAGTLITDKGGECEVSGRVAALLELGSAFHPEMSGRENVYLSGAVMGFSVAEIDKLYNEIVAFAGIEEFMERPVKTYSSGMLMRLAFAVATCVDPDVLIIDEALSVGDGAFARKSFDRIMQFREAKKTILFCSHSLYQVEKICDRVIWLDKGRVEMDGPPAQVLSAYSEFLSADDVSKKLDDNSSVLQTADTQNIPAPVRVSEKTGRITNVTTHTGNQTDTQLTLQSGESNLIIEIDFLYDPTLLPPSVAVGITRKDGLLVSSASTHNDDQKIPYHSEGKGHARITFQQVPLLKGNYLVDVYLACENALHLYDHAQAVASLTVSQEGIEQGIIAIPHEWQMD